jgi:hypothetical protein
MFSSPFFSIIASCSFSQSCTTNGQASQNAKMLISKTTGQSLHTVSLVAEWVVFEVSFGLLCTQKKLAPLSNKESGATKMQNAQIKDNRTVFAYLLLRSGYHINSRVPKNSKDFNPKLRGRRLYMSHFK